MEETPVLHRLLLVIDNSMSMNGKRLKTCVNTLILNLQEFAQIRVQLYTFNDYCYKYKTEHLLPNDRELLEKELSGILCSSQTSLHDTLCDIKKKMWPNDYIFLITDGDDTSSKKHTKMDYENDILDLLQNKQICMIQPKDSHFQNNVLEDSKESFSQCVDFDNQLMIQRCISDQMIKLKSNMSQN